LKDSPKDFLLLSVIFSKNTSEASKSSSKLTGRNLTHAPECRLQAAARSKIPKLPLYAAFLPAVLL
jgi:hypothetical protein